MRRIVIVLVAAGAVAAAGVFLAPALAPAEPTGDDDTTTARAELRTADGNEVGRVEFESGDDDDGGTTVEVQLDVPDEASTDPAFHGLHVHANDDEANGEGCEADPDADPSTWFTAVDGHLRSGDEAHGYHLGDLPSIQLDDGGRGHAEYSARRLTVDDLDGKAVVLHAEPDNFGNVPAGSAADQYTANSASATEKTAASGNSGNRIACGVVKVG